MKGGPVVLTLVVLLSGCSGLATDGGSPSSATATPAPVPTMTPTARPAAAEACHAPPPETPVQTAPPTPAEPAALPLANGTVDGSALVAGHAAALSGHSFHLRLENRAEAWVMPEARAFTYEGRIPGFLPRRAYAVGGTLYTLDRLAGDGHVERRPYRPGSAVYERYAAAVTGLAWLATHVGRWNYTVLDTRRWNGTRVRVLEAVSPDRISVTDAKTLRVDSRVFVDRRGIVRFVDHERTLEHREQLGLKTTTHRTTLSITGIGTTRLHRPPAFCDRFRASDTSPRHGLTDDGLTVPAARG